MADAAQALRDDDGAARVDVTVVLPAYNAAELLEDAVGRLLRQTLAGLEVVVVDDGSADATAAVGAALAARHPQVRLLVQETNGGVAAARERGVAGARGRFVWFVDADDAWPDDAAATLLAAAERTSADVVCAGASTVMLDGSVKPVGALPPGEPVLSAAEAFTAFLTGVVSGHLWNKLFSREVLGRVRFTATRQHSDQAMVAQALARAEKVAVVDAVVYRYLLREGSIIRSSTRRAPALRAVGQVVRECAAELGPSVADGPAMRYYLARFQLLSRFKDAVAGDYDDAERRSLVAQARRELTVPILLAPAREGDPRRTVMLGAARWSLPLFRRMVGRGLARG